MKVLKISTAGVRGVVGQGMSAEVAQSFAQAFATYLDGGTVVLARDSRPSGLMMRSAVLSGLLAGGCKVVDLGVCPSPSARVMVHELGAQGGILIAAGHNPPPWNALKFLAEDGSYFSSLQGQELLEIFNHGEFKKVSWEEIFPLEENREACRVHREVLKSRFGEGSIRAAGFKVAVDCCNGTCSLITPDLLRELGCEVVVLNDRITRPFPRFPNPTPDNMSQLESLVRASGAQIGFAHDAEGERLGLVTSDGVALHQEYTLAICARIRLEQDQGPVVTNLSSSRMLDEVASSFGVECHRTPIGLAHVASKALQVGAVIAGEGSGTVILPSFQMAPDGLASILLILSYLARTGRTLGSLVESLPRFFMLKQNVPLPTNQLYRRLHQFRIDAAHQLHGYNIDLTDGVKLSGPDGWVQVRASTTESLLRIITEAKTEERASQLHQFAQEIVLE